MWRCIALEILGREEGYKTLKDITGNHLRVNEMNYIHLLDPNYTIGEIANEIQRENSP